MKNRLQDPKLALFCRAKPPTHYFCAVHIYQQPNVIFNLNVAHG